KDWRQWRKELFPALMSTLGKMPSKVPLNPEVQVVWTEDGLVKQKVIIDVEEGLSLPAYVFRPAKFKGKLPGILACHGHAFGLETIMGNNSRGYADSAHQVNRYGLAMAKAGFSVIAIDWRGFGQRDDRRKPHHSNAAGDRDLCDVHYLRATIMGMTVLGMNIHDGSCALDYLCQQDFVDSDRIGVMGLSLGGTMTTWMSIADKRIKAANVICYSDRFADFGMRDTNFCGSQITPGLYDLCDVPDLQGMIAPRPLLVEIGAYDDCFMIESAMSCYREVQNIYAAAGASEKLEIDLFEGGHQWSGRKSVEFFRKHL
ncbi:MAG: hypothetical protein EHM48_08235, partial [Planctomycetaceae bacterium]